MASRAPSTQAPLRVLVVGAGIGGLAAAIALRQQGHIVEIYEQSRLTQENGAAVHIAPNVYGLLTRLGIDVEAAGGNKVEQWTQINARTGQPGFSLDTSPLQPWAMIDRGHLHAAMKTVATAAEGVGLPAKLHTGCRVEKGDTSSATLRLANESIVHGDLIVGADGLYSKAREAITTGTIHPFDTGQSAFRMFLPIRQLTANPVTAELVAHPGRMVVWIAKDRRVILYPCANNTTANIVAIHPSGASSVYGGEQWHLQGSKENMLRVFDSFGPQVQALLRHADEEEVKLWRVLDMPKLPSFVKNRLALIGDAAHPTLPHQAQGGAQAIEDAVSLAALLPLGTPAEEVPTRLELYNSCRYERTHRVQDAARAAGEDGTRDDPADDDDDERVQVNVMEPMRENIAHDEWLSSSLALIEHRAAERRRRKEVSL